MSYHLRQLINFPLCLFFAVSIRTFSLDNYYIIPCAQIAGSPTPLNSMKSLTKYDKKKVKENIDDKKKKKEYNKQINILFHSRNTFSFFVKHYQSFVQHFFNNCSIVKKTR